MIIIDEKKKRWREWYEKKTIESMIRIYCKYNHKDDICDTCRELLEYAYKQLEKCPLMPDKPTCKNCHIHCYDKRHKEKIKVVMQFSGPKMFLYHPILSLIYLKNKLSDRRRSPTLISRNRDSDE
ncbi:MAG TPA: nitrous oxide-stimulated promoter family protein [Candidatus Hydrogenedens sp.]|nr:nitrous oxide-stimulated promoter family protein [Candidatus Hydrogenedens sp.]HOK09946.1 nitrous oxide-stimulated promoter family protein [Candidatus Hydrogenedens sp.]HOL19667.1 nitrous oxide-stimulated promoter family protein [Candidatus Hydrogenedens sp.]HPP57733.1 nitrous oxide-stimulated promoter family protein [Candidatus Hydrogenedens sp.]